MLNDIHPPPLEPEYEHGKHPPRRGAAAPPGNGHHLSDKHDRAHELDRPTRGIDGVDLIYPEPEDRGDSFNTTMSAIIVGVVLGTVLLVVYLFWT